jgi:hypothetical protein
VSTASDLADEVELATKTPHATDDAWVCIASVYLESAPFDFSSLCRRRCLPPALPAFAIGMWVPPLLDE